MTTSHRLETVRTASAVVIAPAALAAVALATHEPVLLALGTLAVTSALVARRRGTEQGVYAALIAGALFAGVLAHARGGPDHVPGWMNLAAAGALVAAALAGTGRRRPVRRGPLPPAPDPAPRGPSFGSELPDARGVAAHDALAFVGRDARELLVDQGA